jgi:hypothetical protein
MTDIAEHDLQATIQAWEQAAWSLAALALTAHTRGDGPLCAHGGSLSPPPWAAPAFGLQQLPQPAVPGPHCTPGRRLDEQAALPTRSVSG